MQTNRRLILVIGLIVGIPLVILLFLAGAGALFYFTAKDLPVSETDKSYLIRYAQLAELTYDRTPLPTGETFKKTKYLDGSLELDYEYESADSYLSCTLTVEKNAGDARTTYTAESAGIKLGLSIGGQGSLTLVERDDLLKWGDQSRCVLVKNGALNVGNYFITRKGKRIYSILFTGIYIDDPEVFKGLLLPALLKIDSFNP